MDTTTGTRPSSASFRDALVLAIAQLADFKANVLVSMDTCLETVRKATGIAEDAYGVQSSSGKPQVNVWIQVAWHDLKTQGLGAGNSPRGKWVLTTAGIAKARLLAGETAAPEVASEEAPEPEAPVIHVLVAPSAHEHYHSDPYIRQLAIAATPCFGCYTSHPSANCGNCSLRAACSGFVSAELSKLNVVWEKALKLPSAPTKAKAADKSPKWDNKNSEKIIAIAECECYRCQGLVAKDEECFWIPETGVFHLACE